MFGHQNQCTGSYIAVKQHIHSWSEAMPLWPVKKVCGIQPIGFKLHSSQELLVIYIYSVFII
jgi:hypothetical protein